MTKPTWTIEETHPELAKNVREDLREVMDPELGMNIIQLGLVRNIQIEDAEALVTMILTTPFCPYAPQLMEATRQQAEESLNIPTKIEMGDEVWDRSFLEEDDLDWGLF
jgi:metal-sulfur cluster biosynthetic enzyme